MRTLSTKNTKLHILKSNINTEQDVRVVENVLNQIKAITRWSIDLDDWERVLKVESFILSSANISVILSQFGYECAELDH